MGVRQGFHLGARKSEREGKWQKKKRMGVERRTGQLQSKRKCSGERYEEEKG